MDKISGIFCCLNKRPSKIIEYILLVTHVFGLVGIVVDFIGIPWDAVASGMEYFLLVILLLVVGSLAATLMIIYYRKKDVIYDEKHDFCLLICKIMLIVCVLGFLLSFIFFIVVIDQMRRSGDEDDRSEVEEVIAIDWVLTIIGTIILICDWVALGLMYLNVFFRIKLKIEGAFIPEAASNLTLGIINRNSNDIGKVNLAENDNKERVVSVGQNEEEAKNSLGKTPFGGTKPSYVPIIGGNLRQSHNSNKSDETPPEYKGGSGRGGNINSRGVSDIKNPYSEENFNTNNNNQFGSFGKTIIIQTMM